MKKSYLSIKNSLSSEIPSNILVYNIDARELAEETVRFLEENFEGLFEVDYTPPSYGNVIASVDNLGYFLRLLSLASEGRDVIKLKIFELDGMLTIKTPYGYESFTARGVAAGLISAARDAGMTVYLDERGRFTLAVPIKPSRDLTVRAFSHSTIRQRLEYVFFGPPRIVIPDQET